MRTCRQVKREPCRARGLKKSLQCRQKKGRPCGNHESSEIMERTPGWSPDETDDRYFRRRWRKCSSISSPQNGHGKGWPGCDAGTWFYVTQAGCRFEEECVRRFEMPLVCGHRTKKRAGGKRAVGNPFGEDPGPRFGPPDSKWCIRSATDKMIWARHKAYSLGHWKR